MANVVFPNFKGDESKQNIVTTVQDGAVQCTMVDLGLGVGFPAAASQARTERAIELGELSAERRQKELDASRKKLRDAAKPKAKKAD